MLDAVVVGASVAGLALARSLPAHWQVAVVDPQPSRLALPTAIAHPFPGRSAAIAHGFEAYSALRAALTADCFRALPMVRPLANSAERLWVTALDQRERAGQYGITVEHFRPEELAERFPKVSGSHWGVVYQPALSIDVPGLLDSWARAAPARLLDAPVRRLERSVHGWTVFAGEESIASKRVALCVGASLPRWFPNLAVRVVAGAVVTVDGELAHAVSGFGRYAAPVCGRAGRVCVGATRHDPSDSLTDEQVLDRLLGEPLVELAGTDPKIWRGQRLMVPADRRPIIGAIESHDGLFVLGALGSKGLFWSPLAGQWLAGLMSDGTPIPAAMAPKRVAGDYLSPLIAAA